MYSIIAKNIARINFALDIKKLGCHMVGDNYVGAALKIIEILNYSGMEKFIFLQRWFVNNDVNAFGFNALHNALNG